MDPALIKKALEALKNGDGDGAIAILEEMIASAASGGAAPPAEGEALAENPDVPVEEEPMQAAALSRLEKIEGLIASLSAIVESREAERTTVESAERVQLVGELVKLRAEEPATAWDGEGDKRKPAAHLLAEPIASLRSRVAKLRAVRPAPTTREHEPPAAQGDLVAQLSKSELAACKRKGIDPADFAQRKANAVRRVS